MKKYVIVLVFNCASMVLHAQSYLVTDYGAVADGSTLNTASIQAAIDDCNAPARESVPTWSLVRIERDPFITDLRIIVNFNA